MKLVRFGVSAAATATIALAAALPSVAAAQQYPLSPPSSVLANNETRDLSDPGDPGDPGGRGRSAAVLGTQANRGQVRSAGLAVTGGDLAGLALMGVALVGGGTVVLRRSRRPAVA